MDPNAFTIINGISIKWAAVSGLFCLIFGAGGTLFLLKYKVGQVGGDIKDLKEQSKKYVLLENCDKRHHEQSTQFCRKVDEIKTHLEVMDQKREDARVDQAALAENIKNLEKTVRQKIC